MTITQELATKADDLLGLADSDLTDLYTRLCDENPVAAHGFLMLLGDWREKTLRLKGFIELLKESEET